MAKPGSSSTAPPDEHPCVSVETTGARFALHPPTPFALDSAESAFKLLLPFGVASVDVAIGDGGSLRLRSRPGDLYFAEPGSRLRATHVAPLEFLLITLAPERVRAVAETAVGAQWRTRDLVPWHDQSVAVLGAEMRRALIGESLPPAAYLGALADALVARTVIHIATETARAPREALAPATLARVMRHIDSALGEAIDGAALAAIAGLSTAHFARAFARATGDPPHRFVMKRRVCQARDMLSSSDVGIAEIAARTGFSSQAHLSTAFMREVGTSPAKYRLAFAQTALNPIPDYQQNRPQIRELRRAVDND